MSNEQKWQEELAREEDGGRMSIRMEYRGTPEQIKKGKRIIRRTMYRLRAAGVLVFGTVIVRRTGEIRNIVFTTARGHASEVVATKDCIHASAVNAEERP